MELLMLSSRQNVGGMEPTVNNGIKPEKDYICRAMSSSGVFKELFQRLYRPLCMYALHYLKDVQAAEDAVQDVFVSFWERDVDADDARAYLYGMTRNKCVDILRRTGFSADDVRAEDAAGAISDEDAVNRSSVEAGLWEAIGRLPRSRRELLLMSKRDGMTYEDIAESKGLSVNTVRNQISRALNALRKERDRIIDFVLFFFVIPAI